MYEGSRPFLAAMTGLSQEGLVVVDVYAKWAGPCSLMRPVILKVKAKVRRGY